MKEMVDALLKRLTARAAKWLLGILLSALAGIGLPIAYSAEAAWRVERDSVEKALSLSLTAHEIELARQREAISRIEDWTRETREDVREMRRLLERRTQEGR